MNGASDAAYKEKILDLRTEFETVAQNLSVAKGEVDSTKSIKAVLDREVSGLESKKSSLLADVVSIETQRTSAIQSHKILLEAHGNAEKEARKKVDHLDEDIENKKKESSDLDEKKKQRDQAINERDEAFRNRDAALEREKKSDENAARIIKEAEAKAEGLESREKEAAEMKAASGAQSTENERRAAQIYSWAKKLQGLATSTNFLGDNGQPLDVFKELGITRDTV